LRRVGNHKRRSVFSAFLLTAAGGQQNGKTRAQQGTCVRNGG